VYHAKKKFPSFYRAFRVQNHISVDDHSNPSDLPRQFVDIETSLLYPRQHICASMALSHQPYLPSPLLTL
jgi:hypothetical protein